MFSRLSVWLLLAAVMATQALAAERNAWPFWVGQEDPASGQITAQEMFGPLYASQDNPDGSAQRVLRPLWLNTTEKDKITNYFLYPLFTSQQRGQDYYFTILQLINYSRDLTPADKNIRHFDVWPIYFSRETPDPALTYHAVFPIAGTITERFGKDRLTWFLFPLYFNTDKAGMQITSVPWPIIRVIKGAGHHGFEIWPLFGSREHPGDYHNQFYLWPLIYKYENHLSEPQPDVKLGALPFYASDSGPGYRSETYVWPFFGYTHRTLPEPYDETRYFWPLLVQGRGEHNYVNRFGPVYTHSVVKGEDKTWWLWPLYRNVKWSEANVAEEKTSLLYFLYWSLDQHSLTNPAAAPAHKRHLWPLFSQWDNGAGQRQFQLLSPLEVFFPNNDPIRQLYTPLFALYRYNQCVPGDTKHSLLWSFVSWRNSPDEKEFHLGPFGWRRGPDTPRGKFFFFASSSPSATKAPVPSSQ